MRDQAEGLRELVRTVRQSRENVAPSAAGALAQAPAPRAIEVKAVPAAASAPRPIIPGTEPGAVRGEPRPQTGPRIITVASGKGGVGKSSLVLNIAAIIGQTGRKVLVVDADLGLGNIAILGGIVARRNLGHFFAGEADLPQILARGPGGIDVIPGASGLAEIADLKGPELMPMLKALDDLVEGYDFVMVDTGAGISSGVVSFALASDDLIVVTMPEDIAITDAYGLIKTLVRRGLRARVHLVVNRTRVEADALSAIDRIRMVANHFLGFSLEDSGIVMEDPTLRSAAMKQEAVAVTRPYCRVTRDMRDIARKMITRERRPGAATRMFESIAGFFCR